MAVVIPCCNRPRDAELLFGDLARLNAQAAHLRIILVDNCSEPPLSTIRVPAGLDIEHLRLNTNTGGSGGYNAGLRHALGVDESMRPIEEPSLVGAAPDYLWLVDSDARVRPDTLDALLAVLEADSSIIAAGAAVHDPETGRCFEVAGRINRRNGIYEPAVSGAVGVRGVVEGDYVAAACALVRADVVRRIGVMPDRFLNGDDVEWFIRLAQASGGRVVGVPWAVCWHPRYDRFPTWQRYYTTRNALAPLRALGLPFIVRLRRAIRDAFRAAQQEMMQRTDLARLHLNGLRAAAHAEPIGAAAAGTIGVEQARPLSELADALKNLAPGRTTRTAVIFPGAWLSTRDGAAVENALVEAGCTIIPLRGDKILRRVLRPRADIAIVPARGRPSTWRHGRWVAQVGAGSFVLRRSAPVRSGARAAPALARGIALAWRAARPRRRGPIALDTSLAAGLAARGRGRALSLEAIVLSHERWPALERTLGALRADPAFGQPALNAPARSITVVDNGSGDGTPDHVRVGHADLKLLALHHNIGVEAFNRAAAKSTADVILLLDDDAIPDEHALAIALGRLARDASLGAVALHPRHPRTGRSEWPFASCLTGTRTDAWPLMGCANLVRREAWNAVGGYDGGFFLYRNDADLALKLLGAGRGVHFDPGLVVWHDTPAGPGRAKSTRWHHLATRNWVWMARRHGRGLPRVFGAILGWLWAHRLAGLRPSAHMATLRGAWQGCFRPIPGAHGAHAPTPSGEAWRTLMRLRTRGGGFLRR